MMLQLSGQKDPENCYGSDSMINNMESCFHIGLNHVKTERAERAARAAQ